MSYIEPCCAERQLPQLLKEELERPALMQTSGDMTLEKWMQATLLMAGNNRPRTMTLSICDGLTELTMKVLANYLQLEWILHLNLITHKAVCKQDLERMADLCGFGIEELRNRISLAADEKMMGDVLVMQGQEGIVIIQGPMHAEIRSGYSLYAGVYGREQMPGIRHFTDTFFSHFKSRMYDIDENGEQIKINETRNKAKENTEESNDKNTISGLSREVAIINFNTPELTEAAIMSVRKHGGMDYHITVFDNSDKRPFVKKMRGVSVIDNTHGQVIDFESELEKFPDKEPSIGCADGCEYGSAKHMMTVQKLWEIIPHGFVLLESDILLKENIDFIWNNQYATVGHYQRRQPDNPYGLGRLLPMLCYMNVPLLTKAGARYFDPKRTYGLLKGRNRRDNWYDTGAPLAEDVITKKPMLHGLVIDINPIIEHYGSASWKNQDKESQQQWLERHSDLWKTGEEICKVAVCAIGRMENLYAVEWIEHYKKLGISKFFIYDNNRAGDGEKLSDVLQPYINDGLVKITEWNGLQKQSYEDCYNRHNTEYDWIGFFDFDEFVEFSDDDMTAPVFLSQFTNEDVVVMNWQEMTDNGHLRYETKPLKERFTEPREKDFELNHHVKCFVHSGIMGISFNDPHCPNAPKMRIVNVRGAVVPQVPIQPGEVIHDIARVVHYDTKSTEEYINIKVVRGAPIDEFRANMKRQRAVEYYFGINKRTLEKETVLNKKKQRKRKQNKE